MKKVTFQVCVMECFNIDNYLEKLILRCKEAFSGRLVYVGLQGSWLRGEATENSDIDVMIVLDGFSVEDMKIYRGILKEIGWYEKSCGFICSKDDLANWNPLEALQLKYTTKDLFGKLENLLPPATRQDEVNYVKISLGNFYHENCHRYIHGGQEKKPQQASSELQAVVLCNSKSALFRKWKFSFEKI